MLKTMLRERLPSAAFAFIMVVSIAFIYLYTSSAEALKWNVYEQKYVSKMTADEFLTQYPADYESARNKFFSIDNLEGIDTDDLSEDKLMALLAGDYSFSDAENIWRNRQYSMPGRFADTVINDYEMMSDMYDYYAPMLRYEERLSEKRTINERMLARTGTSNADKIKSEKILSYISEIPEKPDSIAPLVSADIFSESFAKDVLFIFFVAVLCCRMYSGYRQSGYLDFIKTTKCGAGKFFAVQYLSHLVIMTAAYILYCVLYLLFILSGAGTADVLFMPCQVLKSAAYSVFPLNVWQYLLVMAAARYCYYLLAFSLFAFISAICPLDVISSAVCGIVSAVPIYTAYVTAGDTAVGTLGRFVTGNFAGCFDGADLTVIFNIAVPNIVLCTACFIAAFSAVTAIVIITGRILCRVRTSAGTSVTFGKAECDV